MSILKLAFLDQSLLKCWIKLTYLTNSKDVQRIFKPIVSEIKNLVDNQVKAIKEKYNTEPKVRCWYCVASLHDVLIYISFSLSYLLVGLVGNPFFLQNCKTL